MRLRLLALVGGGVGVIWSFIYLALRRSLELVLLCFRAADAKEVEILVLRRQQPRPRLQPIDRALLAALSRLPPRARWSVFLVRPETLLRWHRNMVRQRWTYPTHAQPTACDLRRGAAAGRPACPRESAVGYQRIHGELLRLGVRVSASSIRRALRAHGLDPAPGALQRAGGRSCASRPPASWRVTSSPSTRSSCGECMSCSSSNSKAGGSTLPASPSIRPAFGRPSRPATCLASSAIRQGRGSS